MKNRVARAARGGTSFKLRGQLEPVVRVVGGEAVVGDGTHRGLHPQGVRRGEKVIVRASNEVSLL